MSGIGRMPEPTGRACQQSPRGVKARAMSLMWVATTIPGQLPGRRQRVVQPHREVPGVERDPGDPGVQSLEDVQELGDGQVGVGLDRQADAEILQSGGEVADHGEGRGDLIVARACPYGSGRGGRRCRRGRGDSPAPPGPPRAGRALRPPRPSGPDGPGRGIAGRDSGRGARPRRRGPGHRPGARNPAIAAGSSEASIEAASRNWTPSNRWARANRRVASAVNPRSAIV